MVQRERKCLLKRSSDLTGTNRGLLCLKVGIKHCTRYFCTLCMKAERFITRIDLNKTKEKSLIIVELVVRMCCSYNIGFRESYHRVFHDNVVIKTSRCLQIAMS